MKLRLFKTLWGHTGSFADAVREATDAGFDGLESPAPRTKKEGREMRTAMSDAGLGCILEIATAGGYVPESTAGVGDHLESFEKLLNEGMELEPEKVSCLGGSDFWSQADSIRFFERAMEIAKNISVPVSFETHRSRSLFHPRATQSILGELPGLRLTCDFSHWCVVCERPCMDACPDVLQLCAERVDHVHLRVGYDQGPQVPDPRAPEYAEWVDRHLRWWKALWNGRLEVTATPEFGPDGYLHEEPFTRRPMSDLWQVNRWMGARGLELAADL